MSSQQHATKLPSETGLGRLAFKFLQQGFGAYEISISILLIMRAVREAELHVGGMVRNSPPQADFLMGIHQPLVGWDSRHLMEFRWDGKLDCH